MPVPPAETMSPPTSACACSEQRHRRGRPGRGADRGRRPSSGGPRSPSRRGPRGRPAARGSARRPASPGAMPHLGSPTLTSIRHRPIPAAAAAAIVASESTATVTGGVEPRHRPQPLRVDRLVGQQQVVAEPRRGHADDLSRRRARERRVAGLRLDARQRGALVGLDVRTQRRARSGGRHRRHVAVDRRRIGHERGRPQLRDQHPRSLPDRVLSASDGRGFTKQTVRRPNCLLQTTRGCI